MTVLLSPLLAALSHVAEHLGGLHPYERLLVAVVAFGPFVVLGVVVHLVRRRDLAAERAGQRPEDPAPDPDGGRPPGV